MTTVTQPFLSDEALLTRLEEGAIWIDKQVAIETEKRATNPRGHIEVVNIAGVLDFTAIDTSTGAQEFDSRTLNQYLPSVVDETAQFSRMLLKLLVGDIKATVAIFDGGSTVITGPVNTAKLNAVALYYSQILESIRVVATGRHRYHITGVSVTIRNIVLNGKLPFHVSTIGIRQTYKNSRYVPGDFPGIIVPKSDTMPTFILFDTGAVIISGVRPDCNITEIWDTIIAIAVEHRRHDLSQNPTQRSNVRKAEYKAYMEMAQMLE